MTSAIAKGRIEGLDIDDARAVLGVLDILTSENTSELRPAKFGSSSSTSIQTLGPDVAHSGQIIAVVIADTFEAASEAARRVRVSYSEAKPSGHFRSGRSHRRRCGQGTRATKLIPQAGEVGSSNCGRRCQTRR